MSVQQEKFKEIADKIREYTGTTDLIKPNNFAAKIDYIAEDRYTLGVTDGYANGLLVGNNETTERYEKMQAMMSEELSIALTSGAGNEESLETNVNQAKSDISAICDMLNEYGVQIAVGQPSSTYPQKIRELVTEKQNAGIEQGKQTAQDEFWVDYIRTMNSAWNSSYSIAGFGWNDETFRPTRNLTIYQATNMFASCRITDLADILEKQGVTWSFSSCTNLNSLASYSKITRFPLLDTRSCSSLHGAFDNCASLHTVVKIILKNDGTQTFTNTFVNCTSLANIIFEGVIGQNLDMKSSPLTKESIMGKPITAEEYEALSDTAKTYNVMTIDGVRYYGGVITALKDDATGKTLTLKKTAKEAAFTDEEWIALITPKSNQYDGNWTISLV